MHCAHINARGRLCALHALPGATLCVRHLVPNNLASGNLGTDAGRGFEVLANPNGEP